MFGTKIKIILTICLVVCITLFGMTIAISTSSDDVVEQYSSLQQPQSKDPKDKKLGFLYEVAREYGDDSIVAKKGYSVNPDYAFTYNDNPADIVYVADNVDIDQNDLMMLAKQIASVIDASNPGNAYSNSKFVKVNINGDEVSTRCDCSGFTGALLYYAGLKSSKSQPPSGSYANMGTEVTVNTAQVGDVIYTSGHVEVIVKVETDKVYIANCGSSSAIVKTASQGYSAYYPKNNFDSAYKKGAYSIRRVR